MITVDVYNEPGHCEHCGTKTIHAFRIRYRERQDWYDVTQETFIGRVCLEKITNISTSGNPYRAITRLEKYLNKGNVYSKWLELIDAGD